MTPIYEQIAAQIRKQIEQGILASQECLPSVRSVAKDCHISALTVKKAYDLLEEEGLVSTVHGKGTFVNSVNKTFLEEQTRRSVEEMLEKAVQQARQAGIPRPDFEEMFSLLMDEYES